MMIFFYYCLAYIVVVISLEELVNIFAPISLAPRKSLFAGFPKHMSLPGRCASMTVL